VWALARAVKIGEVLPLWNMPSALAPEGPSFYICQFSARRWPSLPGPWRALQPDQREAETARGQAVSLFGPDDPLRPVLSLRSAPCPADRRPSRAS
jgi:hypothetical protein